MNHQSASRFNGTTSTKNYQKICKKKRKKRFWHVNDNAGNSSTVQQPENTDEITESDASSHPKKKRKREKKTTDDGATENIKPVLVVKSPEDYSANWKMLKEIIAKDEEQKHKDNPAMEKNKKKFIRNRKHKKFHGDYQKTSIKESTEDKMKNQEEEEELDIWFDNVDPILLKANSHNTAMKMPLSSRNKKSNPLVKEQSFDGVTKAVGIDCEMVGVGMDGRDSILARVSLVNLYGNVLYDKFVKPTEEVVDYRTAISGVRPADVENGYEFSIVQKEVSDLIAGRILVGHAVRNDLRALYLSHPRHDIRDTSKYKGFRRLFGGRTPKLKNLVEKLLGVQIQHGEHSSVQDAQAAMRLYTMNRREWEMSRPNKYKKRQLMKQNSFVAKSQQPEASEADTG